MKISVVLATMLLVVSCAQPQPTVSPEEFAGVKESMEQLKNRLEEVEQWILIEREAWDLAQRYRDILQSPFYVEHLYNEYIGFVRGGAWTALMLVRKIETEANIQFVDIPDEVIDMTHNERLRDFMREYVAELEGLRKEWELKPTYHGKAFMEAYRERFN